MESMKVLLRIDPLSATRVVALLGVLWALLGWFMNSLVIVIFRLQGSLDGVGELPPAFSLGGLLSGVVGGLIGGAISGYLGCLVYNALASRVGGVRLELKDVTPPSGAPSSLS